MTTAKWIGAGVLTLAIIAGIIAGGWQLKWWFANSATNHIAHIYQNSYGAQSADEQEKEKPYDSLTDSELYSGLSADRLRSNSAANRTL